MTTKHAFSTKIAKEAFSNLFKKRATELYPETPANVAEGFRGKMVMDLSNCIGCGLCARECPSSAIEMVMVEGKKRPLIHLDQCIFCYQCADTCPKKVFLTSKVFDLAVTDKSTLVLKPEPIVVAPAAPAQTAPSTAANTESATPASPQ